MELSANPPNPVHSRFKSVRRDKISCNPLEGRFEGLTLKLPDVGKFIRHQQRMTKRIEGRGSVLQLVVGCCFRKR